MSLEDFFTLSEMRDGLLSLARVDELLSVIQKLNDHVTNNVGDSARQWSMVASVLAATNHEECLSQFVEFNGLSFLKKWLQEALNSNIDENGIVVEELILSLLTSFERILIDNKRISASGIRATIEPLLDHRSTKIKEKAQVLHDRWGHAKKDDVYFHDQDNAGISQKNQPGTSEDVQTSENGSNSASPLVSIPPSFISGEGKDSANSAGTASQVSNVMSLLYSRNERGSLCEQFHSTSLNTILSKSVFVEENSLRSSLVSNSCPQKLPLIEEPSVCNAEETPPAGTCSPVCLKGDADNQCDVLGSKDVLDTVKEIDMDTKEIKPSKSIEASGVHSSPVFPASDATSTVAAELTISCTSVTYIGDSSSSSRAMEHQPVAAGVVDNEQDKCLMTTKGSMPPENFTTFQDPSRVDNEQDKCLMTTKESMPPENFTTFQDPSRVDNEQDKCLMTTKESMPPENFTTFQGPCNASIRDNISDSQLSGQKVEAMSSVNRDLDSELNFKYCKSHFSASSDFLKVVRPINSHEVTNQKSGLELECLDDALEVARQVAIAVEKEVVNYRENFCSSPNVNPNKAYGSRSPDSEEDKQEELTEQVGRNSSSAGTEHTGASSPDKRSEITQNISSDQDVESSEPKDPAQESVCMAIVDRYAFDLNANIFNDEPERSTKASPKMPLNVSAPVAVVASSKGPPGVPAALHFGGELGWKGSAATSAFRPASPRRTPDGERTSCAMQKSIFLDIDLNVAERVDGFTDEPTSLIQLPSSSSHPSGDSCIEVGSKTEKQNFDLNRIGDEDMSMLPFSSWKLNIQNGERSLSSASSSSYKQSSFRDFDLNDNPSSNDAGCHSFRQSSMKAPETFGWKAPHELVVKIMGSEIPITRTENTNQLQHLFIPNGLQMEPAVVARPLAPCTNVSMLSYGYGGLPSGPAMPVPTAYYSPGSIPYIPEARGVVPLPHVSVSGHAGPSGRPSHFLFGTTNIPYIASSYGMTPPESGIRGGIFEHQLFLQGHRGWMEEQTQSSTSAMPFKRKEPESGWEPPPQPPLNGFKWMTSRP